MYCGISKKMILNNNYMLLLSLRPRIMQSQIAQTTDLMPELANIVCNQLHIDEKNYTQCTCSCVKNVISQEAKLVVRCAIKGKLRGFTTHLQTIKYILRHPDNYEVMLQDIPYTDKLRNAMDQWVKCDCCSFHSKII